MTGKCNVLIYVEDPGAANYVAQLPQALAQAQIDCCLLVDGHATQYLQDRGVQFVAHNGNESAKALLEKYQPQLLLVGTSENRLSLALELIDQARAVNITSAAVIDMNVNAENRFRGQGKDAFTHRPDWILVPDEATRRAYRELSFPAEQIRVCGHPHYDQVLQRAAVLAQQNRMELRQRLLPGAAVDRPVVVFLSEPASILNPELLVKSSQYTLKGRGQSSSRTMIVFEEVLSVFTQLESKPYLVVRLHPKNKPEEFAAYAQDIDFISAGGDPLELIWAADLVVGMTTMLLLEAALMRQNTVSVLPRECEKQWLPCVAENWIPCLTTQVELQQQLPLLIPEAGSCRQAPPLPIKVGSLKQVVDFVSGILQGARTVSSVQH